ncbi:myrosinase 1-like [Anabrus simplex]|uniref:myrosinase 1-like n=1 Tax=Anabrus simplex TaxID=316456 RepID=UPI0035A393A3
MIRAVNTWLLFLGFLAIGAVQGASSNNQFPDGFLFGAASGAYQVEGGWNEDCKGESIWDHMLHAHPDFVVEEQNGDVAADSYHLYKEDVSLLKDLEADFYRFSISWPRIMPTGEANNINQPGIDYYNKLINLLVDNGIQPMITIYHWDLPQWLQDLGGWTNPIIVDYYENYARVLYENFGDRVKWWLTFNDPGTFMSGYTTKQGMAPSIDKPGVGDYLTAHHVLIAHARAYHLYDEQYRATQQGKVRVTLGCYYGLPNRCSKCVLILRFTKTTLKLRTRFIPGGRSARS